MPSTDYLASIASIYADLQALETDRLVLERFTLGLVDDVWAFLSDAEVVRHDPTPLARSRADAEAFVGRFVELHAHGQVAPWAVRLRSSGQCIGLAGYVNWGPVSDRAELGFIFGRPFWGQGLASEAVRAVVAFGMTHMDLNRIEGKTSPHNTAARRLMERQGFRCEALLRQSMFWKGRYHDLCMYALMRADYLAARGGDR